MLEEKEYLLLESSRPTRWIVLIILGFVSLALLFYLFFRYAILLEFDSDFIYHLLAFLLLMSATLSLLLGLWGIFYFRKLNIFAFKWKIPAFYLGTAGFCFFLLRLANDGKWWAGAIEQYSSLTGLLILLLMAGEALCLFQTITLMISIYRSYFHYPIRHNKLNFLPHNNAFDNSEDRQDPRDTRVLLFVPCYNEPLAVFRTTLQQAAVCDYVHRVVYLDDSNKEKVALGTDYLTDIAGISKDNRFWRSIRPHVEGNKAGNFNAALWRSLWRLDAERRLRYKVPFKKSNPGKRTDFSTPKEKRVFIGILDSDQVVQPDFVEKALRIFQHKIIKESKKDVYSGEDVAFYQTPQNYGNLYSTIASAAHYQQILFFRTIMEGKHTVNSAYCCGTNVLFRKESLILTSGIDTESITEDFATSVDIHSGPVVNRTVMESNAEVTGQGPSGLNEYFKQQDRWATGNINSFFKILERFLCDPGALNFKQWHEYFSSSVYYMTGMINLFWMVLPLLYVFIGISPMAPKRYTLIPFVAGGTLEFETSWLWVLTFFPYLSSCLLLFYFAVLDRANMNTEKSSLTFSGLPVKLYYCFLAIFAMSGVICMPLSFYLLMTNTIMFGCGAILLMQIGTISIFLFILILIGFQWDNFKRAFDGQALAFCSFHYHIISLFKAILPFIDKSKFTVTPKAGGNSVETSAIWGIYFMIGFTAAGLVWGIGRIFQLGDWHLAPICLILLYHLALLSRIWRFNQPFNEIEMASRNIKN